MHTGPVNARALAGVSPAFSPLQSLFTTPKSPKLSGDTEVWARLIEQQNPTQMARGLFVYCPSLPHMVRAIVTSLQISDMTVGCCPAFRGPGV